MGRLSRPVVLRLTYPVFKEGKKHSISAVCAFKRSPRSFDPLAWTGLNSQTFPDWLTDVLAALEGMTRQLFRSFPAPDRHDQGACNHLGCHLIAHGPTNETPREQLDDGCNLEPSFRTPNVSDVSQSFLVRPIRIKLSFKRVGSYDRPCALVFRRLPTLGMGFEFCLLHQSFNALYAQE